MWELEGQWLEYLPQSNLYEKLFGWIVKDIFGNLQIRENYYSQAL